MRRNSSSNKTPTTTNSEGSRGSNGQFGLGLDPANDEINEAYVHRAVKESKKVYRLWSNKAKSPQILDAVGLDSVKRPGKNTMSRQKNVHLAQKAMREVQQRQQQQQNEEEDEFEEPYFSEDDGEEEI